MRVNTHLKTIGLIPIHLKATGLISIHLKAIVLNSFGLKLNLLKACELKLILLYPFDRVGGGHPWALVCHNSTVIRLLRGTVAEIVKNILDSMHYVNLIKL